MKFKIEGTTADKRLIAFGKTPEELFQNAALGMYSEMVDLEEIQDADVREIRLEGAGDTEGLLVGWLNELLYLFDSEDFVGTRFCLSFPEEGALQAQVYGAIISQDLVFGEIKAATYHEIQILEKGGAFEARIILDV
jgi:SHS2 domain-containing protein